MPNFLILGAAKAGTTALHQYFQQHPEIYMTPSKETNFFAFEGKKLCFQGPGDDGINQFSITSLDRYQEEFKEITTEKAWGEACPLYLYDVDAAERISRYLPDAKLLVILRHPIQRAYANYLHLVRDGREPLLNFADALAQEDRRAKESWEWFWQYSKIGLYGRQLERFYHRFDAQQIQVYLYEDFRLNPIATMQKMFDFLGVSAKFCPDMSERPNKSGMPKNEFLHQLLTRPNPIKSCLKPLFPKQLRQKIQHRNLVTPALSQEVYAYLLDQYREDIHSCQSLIQRDLSAWLSPQ